MGYYVDIDTSVRIDVAKTKEIITLVQEVFKTVGSSFVDKHGVAEANTLMELFSALRFDSGECNTEGVKEIYTVGCFDGEKLDYEDSYWPLIIGLCEPESMITLVGEDGNTWAYRQKDGGKQINKEFPPDPIPTYDPKCPCCGSLNIKTTKNKGGRKFIKGTCKDCSSKWTAEVQWLDLEIQENNHNKVREVKEGDLRKILKALENREVGGEVTGTYEKIIQGAEEQLKKLLA